MLPKGAEGEGNHSGHAPLPNMRSPSGPGLPGRAHLPRPGGEDRGQLPTPRNGRGEGLLGGESLEGPWAGSVSGVVEHGDGGPGVEGLPHRSVEREEEEAVEAS